MQAHSFGRWGAADDLPITLLYKEPAIYSSGRIIVKYGVEDILIYEGSEYSLNFY
jgi:hypothetical protein